MPTYLYETVPHDPNAERRRFEVRQGFDEPALTRDPETGLPVRRVISGGFGLMTKGGKELPQAQAPGCGPGSCTCGRFN